MSGYYQIVQVAVSQTQAPAPSTLQRTGAFISQGGTTLTPGTYSLLTQAGSLTSLLAPAKQISTAVWSGGTVTVTMAGPHGYTVSDTVPLTIAGCTPTAYNNPSVNCTITGASTFTYSIVSNPGSLTVPGTVTVEEDFDLVGMNTTFFAQGSTCSVYVLELGAGNAADGVTALQTFIAANSQFFYAYLVPRLWQFESTFYTFLQQFQSTTAKTYFYVTMKTNTYTAFTDLDKCVFGMIEAPTVFPPFFPTNTEMSIAAPFYDALNINPSTTNKVAPFQWRQVAGVTPYPTQGNNVLFTTLKNAGVNIIVTGSEGGLANTYVYPGTTMDGRDLTYWYSVDWVQINLNLDLTNEIINGSNNPQNPLYYNQDGINRLQLRAQGTMNRGVTYGLVLPPVTVTAVPFQEYVLVNESDYPQGIYNGLATTYSPNRGFGSLLFNVQVTDFPSA